MEAMHETEFSILLTSTIRKSEFISMSYQPDAQIHIKQNKRSHGVTLPDYN